MPAVHDRGIPPKSCEYLRARDVCDMGQGQWMDAPGFGWLSAGELTCWIAYAWSNTRSQRLYGPLGAWMP
jgi:hypothetical protein